MNALIGLPGSNSSNSWKSGESSISKSWRSRLSITRPSQHPKITFAIVCLFRPGDRPPGPPPVPSTGREHRVEPRLDLVAEARLGFLVAGVEVLPGQADGHLAHLGTLADAEAALEGHAVGELGRGEETLEAAHDLLRAVQV